MTRKPLQPPRNASPYGSAKDLPSYRELSQQIQGAKLLTRFIARDQRAKILKVEQELHHLANVVDDFYDRLGSRNWIFHDLLNVSKIEAILAETSEPKEAESRLIDLYRDNEATKFWTMRLRAHDGFRARLHQISRAKAHYDEGQFDSCVFHLIAVMDGFVNDFEPDVRKGLASRDPDDMSAWDSVVGHHMGLTHVMSTFRKTIKKRVDDEVFELYRHGIVHGSVVNFNNVVVATKAWNMLFAVSDWASATLKAAQPAEPKPTLSDTWGALKRYAAQKKYEKEFVPSTAVAADPGFKGDELVSLATEFLHAWSHGRWSIVARFTPPSLLRSGSNNEVSRFAKEVFEHHVLTNWEITQVSRDQASSAEIRGVATVNGKTGKIGFRVVLWTVDGKVGIPGDEGATWRLAVWSPSTYFETQ